MAFPGLGELLLALAPSPAHVGTAALSGGAAAFGVPVPAAPSLIGVALSFQGAAVGAPPAAIELSNALSATVEG